MTNVKKTTPSTFVAFCSSRMMRPCRDEFLEITLEFREWCERTVAARANSDCADFIVFVFVLALKMFESMLWAPLKLALFMPLMSWLLLRSVAERRRAEVSCGTLLELIKSCVWWLPKLEPRRDFCVRRVSHVTTEFDLTCGVVEKLNFRIGFCGDVAGVTDEELVAIEWFDGAVNRLSDGAELRIVIAHAAAAAAADGDVTNVVVPVDDVHAVTGIWLLVGINGESSCRLRLDTIFTSAGRNWCDFEPKYGHVHGGGKIISFKLVPLLACTWWCIDLCCCGCRSWMHGWALILSLMFRRFFEFFICSVSTGSPSSSHSLSHSTSPNLFESASTCSIRGKLLNRFRSPGTEYCESFRSSVVDHVECDARRLLSFRRCGDIGLQ